MGKEIELIVGRSDSSDIQIDSDLVSGRHLRILKLNSTVFIEELGSTNGTTVDGEVLSKGVKKIITLDSAIVLSKKITLDLNHYKIQSLELPKSSISENAYSVDLDETEADNIFAGNEEPFALHSDSSTGGKKKWFFLGIGTLIVASVAICFSGKFALCNQVMAKEEVKVETPEKVVEDYVMVAPKFMGSSKSNSSVFFANKTDKLINVKLIDINIEGIPYDGIVVPLNGKEKFMVFANDTYEYKLLLEESVTKDLEVGTYSCKVIFKVTVEGKKPKMESVAFPIEIVNH